MQQTPMQPTLTEFLDHLRLRGKHETARTYREHLTAYQRWLDEEGLDAMRVALADLQRFQRYLAEEYRSPAGRPLGRTTQALRLSSVRAFYRWAERRGLLVADPARDLRLPRIPRTVSPHDHLTIQEAVALLDAQAAAVAEAARGSQRWALEVRDLALLCVAIASGRRRGGLRALRVADIDQVRHEMRVQREKGGQGRVLPIAAWATRVVAFYIAEARPILCREHRPEVLFVSARHGAMGKDAVIDLVARAQARAVAAHPDLVSLAGKHLTPHGLRVTFAHLLFSNDADLATINALMLHRNLSTTARYTPVPFEDLRRACAAAHPRA